MEEQIFSGWNLQATKQTLLRTREKNLFLRKGNVVELFPSPPHGTMAQTGVCLLWLISHPLDMLQKVKWIPFTVKWRRKQVEIFRYTNVLHSHVYKLCFRMRNCLSILFWYLKTSKLVVLALWLQGVTSNPFNSTKCFWIIFLYAGIGFHSVTQWHEINVAEMFFDSKTSENTSLWWHAHRCILKWSF